MNNSWESLREAAHGVAKRAYAPYSRFYVGASVELKSGEIVSACNVENVSYGLSVCAERNLVGRLRADGTIAQVQRLAIYTEASPPSAPCGMCRQVLSEFYGDLEILLFNDKGEERRTNINALLPMSFSVEELKTGQQES